MSLAEKLVSLRKQKGLTQMDLAEQLNVSRQAVSRWEVGVAVPSTDNLKILGELYGVRVDYLLNDKEIISESSERQELFQDVQVEPVKSKKHKELVLCILIIAVFVAVAIGVVRIQEREWDQSVPIENMTIEEDDGYLEVTFPLN